MNLLRGVIMRNKKAQFFSIYLVLLTLLMCGIVISFNFIHQSDLASSLISPLPVLEVRDNLDIFEMREKELIKESLNSIETEFGDEVFLSEFRNNFINGFLENSEMNNFVFDNLIWKERVIGSELDRDSFINSILYPESESEINSDELSFVRAKIGKRFPLRAKDVAEINFPVDFLFEFEKKYLINFENGEWVIS